MGYKGAVRVFEINREVGGARESLVVALRRSLVELTGLSTLNRTRGASLHHHSFWIKSNSRCLVRPGPVHRYWPRERNSQPVGYGESLVLVYSVLASSTIVGDDELQRTVDESATREPS